MDSNHEDLTVGERRYLEHARSAKSQGIFVVARGRSGWKTKSKSGAFVAVRVAASSVGATGPTCRLRHPSGWVIECASLPDVRWLSALLSGGAP